VVENLKGNRELIRRHLEKATWINRDNDDLQMRKDCLQYLRKLGRRLKGTTNLTPLPGVILEEDDNHRLSGSNNYSSRPSEESLVK
jgi:hypothetical protein